MEAVSKAGHSTTVNRMLRYCWQYTENFQAYKFSFRKLYNWWILIMEKTFLTAIARQQLAALSGQRADFEDVGVTYTRCLNSKQY